MEKRLFSTFSIHRSVTVENTGSPRSGYLQWHASLSQVFPLRRTPVLSGEIR